MGASAVPKSGQVPKSAAPFVATSVSNKLSEAGALGTFSGFNNSTAQQVPASVSGIHSQVPGSQEGKVITVPFDLADYNIDMNIVAQKGQVTSNIFGMLKVFDPMSGWGFIVGNKQTQNTDVFVHRNAFLPSGLPGEHHLPSQQPPCVHITAQCPDEIRPKVRYTIDWSVEDKPKAEQCVRLPMKATGPGNSERGQSRICQQCLSTIAPFHGICAVCKGNGKKGEKGGNCYAGVGDMYYSSTGVGESGGAKGKGKGKGKAEQYVGKGKHRTGPFNMTK